MNAIKDGGPAFPHNDWNEELASEVTRPGMSLRDYFAATALQGWLASYGPDSRHPDDVGHSTTVARQAYAMADAMIAERGKAYP